MTPALEAALRPRWFIYALRGDRLMAKFIRVEKELPSTVQRYRKEGWQVFWRKAK